MNPLLLFSLAIYAANSYYLSEVTTLLFAFLFFNASAIAAFFSSSVSGFASPAAFLASSAFSAAFASSAAFAFAFAFFFAFLLAFSPPLAASYFSSVFFSSAGFSAPTPAIISSNSLSSRAFFSFLDNYFAGFSSINDKKYLLGNQLL